MNDFKQLTHSELEEVNGGIVITGALVVAGFGLFSASFGVGYLIGQSSKKKK